MQLYIEMLVILSTMWCVQSAPAPTSVIPNNNTNTLVKTNQTATGTTSKRTTLPTTTTTLPSTTPTTTPAPTTKAPLPPTTTAVTLNDHVCLMFCKATGRHIPSCTKPTPCLVIAPW